MQKNRKWRVYEQNALAVLFSILNVFKNVQRFSTFNLNVFKTTQLGQEALNDDVMHACLSPSITSLTCINKEAVLSQENHAMPRVIYSIPSGISR